ncbi:hypothetical protein [Sphingomonas sp. KR3-1]|uniref:hypothetical protein n=1 Tax=Sphingomonas sp. KR3-1 TaxID=3156611 RepID=UPI0032B56E9C
MILGAMLLAGMAADPAAPSAQGCAVIEAAYTVATGSDRRLHPVDLRPAEHALDLSGFGERYIARMPLRQDEFAMLKAREALYPSAQFQPRCTWTSKAKPQVEYGETMAVAVTNPIFSERGQLALVEVSFYGNGLWGHGELCVVRRTAARWTAECLRSWIA